MGTMFEFPGLYLVIMQLIIIKCLSLLILEKGKSYNKVGN